MSPSLALDFARLVIATPADQRPRVRADLGALSAAGVATREGLFAAASRPDLAPGLRCVACWTIARVEDPRARGALRGAALADADPEVRGAAARALGTCGRGAEDVEALGRALADPVVSVRRDAACALGEVDGPVEPLLVSALQDAGEQASVRSMAAEQLVYRTAAPGVADALIAALGDDSAEVRFWAAYALGESREERAVEPLARLRGDGAVVAEWWSVGREAAWALERIARGWEEGGPD
jgi:HEAT repeat protein